MNVKSFIFACFLFLFSESEAQTGLKAELFFPDKIISGKSFTVNLRITKPANLTGFTSFTQKIPEGFFVKPLNTQNAVFSFKDNMLTLKWIRFPYGEKIDIFYEISQIKGISGKFALNGNISYIVNNKKGEYSITPYPFEIIDKKENIPYNYNTPFTPVNFNYIKCQRQKIPLENGKILVKIKISNFDKDNFILTEEFPKGYKTEIIETSNTSVKKHGQIIQFISENTRDKKDITLKYELIPITKKTKNEIKIYGRLAFIENRNIFNLPVLEKR